MQLHTLPCQRLREEAFGREGVFFTWTEDTSSWIRSNDPWHYDESDNQASIVRRKGRCQQLQPYSWNKEEEFKTTGRLVESCY
jgi:hypothetical protein